MSEENNKSIIFLQVMAHDLLAPLTAIKWQSELLEKSVKDKKKRESYIEGIRNSTELGISITKNTHVASKVLSGTYEAFLENGNKSKVLDEIVGSLSLQYERHALALEKNIQSHEQEEEVDMALLQLYVWAIAKLFLSITPPNSTVKVVGVQGSEGYEVSFSTATVPHTEQVLLQFENQNSDEAFDQKIVFIDLIKHIAHLLHVSPTLFVEGDVIILKTGL